MSIFVITTATRPCSSGRRRCPTTQRCVREDYFCDGDNDCGDYSDERRDECRESSSTVLSISFSNILVFDCNLPLPSQPQGIQKYSRLRLFNLGEISCFNQCSSMNLNTISLADVRTFTFVLPESLQNDICSFRAMNVTFTVNLKLMRF